MGLPVLLFVDEPALCLDTVGISEEQKLNLSGGVGRCSRARAYAGLLLCGSSVRSYVSRRTGHSIV